MKILILGGTTEARALAGALAGRDEFSVTLSLAGRTANPLRQAVPTRIGGFGGAEGLERYLRQERIEALIDATHPYAAIISANAARAAERAKVPLLALRRPAWTKVEGDQWTEVANMHDAVAALGTVPRRVFLAMGRKEIEPFTAAPEHVYLVRSVDPSDAPSVLVHHHHITSRGPFELAAETALLRDWLFYD